MNKVLIVGGGAAGMMAGISAAMNNNEVHIFEKNEKLGKKVYITGKGRCNITNSADLEDFFDNIVSNKKFLYSSIYSFTNDATMSFFEEAGLEIKTERGNRIFPVSDKSSDVIKCLEKELRKSNVNIHLKTSVKEIVYKDNKFQKIVLADKTQVFGDSVIIATGGLSYQSTGSTGDGYEFAKKMGHKIINPEPALVALDSDDEDIKELQGLSLKNVEANLYSENRLIRSDFGEMLFTHFGVSGPIILSSSSYIKDNDKNLRILIDLKPALTSEQLDKRLLRDFEENINKVFKNSLDKLVPKKLIDLIIKKSGISPEKKVNEITKTERKALVDVFKRFEVKISGKRGFNEAIITKGGIDVKEINPTTLESKKINGVYFAGEVIDIDALTGGYNLQLAWSTGYLAGLSANSENV